MQAVSQVVNAGRETASDEVRVRTLERRLENAYIRFGWEGRQHAQFTV